MLNFILMDDEMNHNLNMEKRLDRVFRMHGLDAVVALSATDPSQVLQYSLDHVDIRNVYLLDVDCKSNINGIELALQIREHDVQSYIVFVSAHPEFVMPSLKTKVFDFLIKPISYETLENCVLTIQKDFTFLNKEKKQTLVIKSGLNVYQIKIEDIVFFEKYGHLLVVHTVNGLIRSKESLENIMSKLDSSKFFKCHKSYLVNLDYIKEIDNTNNLIFFHNGESCQFSKRSKKELKMVCTS